jgi:PAS domain S-box-containing protein
MSSIEAYAPVEGTSEAAALFRLTDRLYRAVTDHDVHEAALDAIVDTLDCRRASILLFDEAGVMQFVAARGLSEEYRRKLAGHTPWKPGHRDPQPIFVSDIDDTDEPGWIKQVIKEENIRALAFIPLVARGVAIGKFMTYYEAPRSFSRHESDLAVMIARQVGFSIERSRSEKARRAIEHELRESEERFRLMSEHAPVMIWMTDAQGKCLHLNKLLREFWGVSEENIATFDWSTTIHPEDVGRIGETMTRAMAERGNVSLNGRYRRADGSYRVLHTDARPRLSDGQILGMIGVNVDITEREEAEAARRNAEARRELLVAELNHRVKNTLSVVQAIANQTFRGTAEQERAAFEGRLRALARSHDLLTKSDWRSVSLREVAAMSVQDAEEARATIEGPPILLSPARAVALGMVLHELFTNALKYGALSNGGGRVAVRWTPDRQLPDAIEISWQEVGGPPVSAPARKGFGSILVERMVKSELEGDVEMEFRPQGFACRINASLAGNAPAGVRSEDHTVQG